MSCEEHSKLEHRIIYFYLLNYVAMDPSLKPYLKIECSSVIKISAIGTRKTLWTPFTTWKPLHDIWTP